MKRLMLVVLSLVFFNFTCPVHAQFFKKLGKKVEKSVERRINKKQDKAVEKTLDKTEEGVDDAAKEATTASNKNKKNRKKKAKEGKGVWPTAAESGNREMPDNYELGLTGSGPDMYLEYKMDIQTSSQEAMDMDINMKLFSSISQGGSRSEINMKIPMMGKRSIVTLTKLDDPTHIVTINEKKQTYSIMDAYDDADDALNFSMKKIGTETLHGLKTVHIRIHDDDGQTFDIWTSKDIPGYQKMVDVYRKSGRLGSNGMWNKMVQSGNDGILVKMEASKQGVTTVMHLVRIEKSKFSKSMFLVPDGYKKTKNAAMGGILLN